MDLIYMNSNKEDIGVLKDYTFDLEFGSEQNNFECTVNSNNHVCEAGYYLYYEGAEYGGIIDSVNIDTESKTVKYIGRTWHGIIESKILQPDIGADYLTVNGEANTVIASLVSRMGIGALFKVSTKASGINISNYKMNRYVGGYTGIMKMLKKSNAKLEVAFKKGFVELSTSPFTDYSQDEQFDTDQISFTIQKNYKPLNHVICLGQGDLKERRVIHVYADALGNISGTQTLTGLDEVCATYDNSNAESDDELKQGGFDMIAEAWASDSIDFNFTSDAESFDINDVIGAKELTTDTIVTASITKKIVKIVNNTTTISYECEGNSGTISSGSYPSSGSGGGGSSITIDDALSETSTNPVQNKVVTSALNGKAASNHTHDERYYTESEVNDLLSGKQDSSTAITTSNIGSQSVNYATSAGAVAWGNVSGKPYSSFGNASQKTVLSASAATDSHWSTTADRAKVPDMTFMAYWNGAYSSTTSNLKYSANGTIIGSALIKKKTVTATGNGYVNLGLQYASNIILNAMVTSHNNLVCHLGYNKDGKYYMCSIHNRNDWSDPNSAPYTIVVTYIELTV